MAEKKFTAPMIPDVEQREIDHMNLSRRLGGECVVLLENDGTLPLDTSENIAKVALFGNGARKTVKGGTGSGDVNTRNNVNVEQGFVNAGATITTLNWLERQDERLKKAKDEYLEWAGEEAKKQGKPLFCIAFDAPFKEPGSELITDEDIANADTDTAVYVIARNSGEGADRSAAPGDYMLFEEEKANIAKIAKGFKKTIVVLNIGGMMDMSELKAIDGVNAIVLMTQLGNLGGDVLLDVLTGKVNPSGKLTDTWAKNFMDYPSSANFSYLNNVHEEYYTDGIFVGYRYFDSFNVEPIYSFGYGKSYTDFSIECKDVRQQDDSVVVDVVVTNIGDKYAGKEVVQIYYSAPSGNIVKPYQELVAYKKTKELAPGEAENISISFAIANMASYDESKAAWVLEKGKYAIRVGNCSSNTTVAAALSIADDVITQKSKNLFALDVTLDEICPDVSGLTACLNEELGKVELVEIDTTTIKCVEIEYQKERKEYHTDKTGVITAADVLAGRATVEELTAQLTVEQLAELCVGTQRSLDGQVVGNASKVVPGAAGDSSSVCYESRGIKNMILADGPAGLRLQPHFKTTKDGEILPGGQVFGDDIAPFDPNINEDEVDNYYQYCTAIPIGWALAQSWNEEIIEHAGDMVGAEMEEFGVDLWLAPAMNIHRNPLCGRNFEYYSEDPVISGKTAAAITRGVQAHKGKGTTIKHFAVNNQEENRYAVNAHVTERALREIYLKSFEITVKESQPMSIMTSYNLLNGIHTANSHDLIQKMARDEWGFEGTVMTDWYTSVVVPEITGKYEHRYPISASTGCIYAGNDMQMPGCQQNVDDIVKAVKTGEEIDGYRITLADLQFNAANMLRIVMKTI